MLTLPSFVLLQWPVWNHFVYSYSGRFGIILCVSESDRFDIILCVLTVNNLVPFSVYLQ